MAILGEREPVVLSAVAETAALELVVLGSGTNGSVCVAWASPVVE